MATTKNDLIRSALRKLGVTGFDSETDPAEFEAALIELEAMMTEWDGRGIRVGYSLAASPEDALGNEDATSFDWARQAIVYHLAIRLAPDYGKPVTPELAALASGAMTSLMAANATIPVVQYPRRMPRGSGNTLRGGFQHRFYTPTEHITVENGGNLDDLEV